MKRFVPVVSVIPVLALVTSLALPARAQDFGKKLEVGANLSLGVAGEVEPKRNGTKFASDDMNATVGMNLFAMYEVFKYIDVGGKFNFLFWRTDTMKKFAIDRLPWIEFDAVLRFKYGFLADALHIYLAMPFGLTISIPNSDLKKFEAGIKTGAGFNMSLVAGVAYMFWRGLGAFLDLGWTFHYTNNKAANNLELENIYNQMALNFGMFYRF